MIPICITTFQFIRLDNLDCQWFGQGSIVFVMSAHDGNCVVCQKICFFLVVGCHIQFAAGCCQSKYECFVNRNILTLIKYQIIWILIWRNLHGCLKYIRRYDTIRNLSCLNLLSRFKIETNPIKNINVFYLYWYLFVFVASIYYC